jgi:hypothetical protein
MSHVRFAPQVVPQHGAFSAPHAAQDPLTQANPAPQAGLHVAPASPPVVLSLPLSSNMALSFDTGPSLAIAPSPPPSLEASSIGSVTGPPGAPGGGDAVIMPLVSALGSAQ